LEIEMSTLVTGGAGYVGRYVLEALRADDTSVVSYDRDFIGRDDPGIRYVQGELFDIPRLLRAIEEDQVDTIVHLAAMSHPQLSVDFPITTVVGNINGTVSVLEAARISAVKRVVKISSESAYGNQPAALISESCRLEPTTPYGVTKAAGEMFAAVYATLYGLDITSLRVTEVYGPGNRVPQMLCEVIDTVLRGDAFVLESGADHPFQFVHVRDVAAAIALAAHTSNLSLPAYNVSSGRVTTLGEAGELVAAAIPGADIRIGAGLLDGHDAQGLYDLSAARADFGYEPQWSLERGIEDYIAQTEGAKR
jgi:UDP-glucose 4-epimerase